MSVRKLQVILNDDVEGLGRAGDLVKVKPGLARNHLLPKSMASYDTTENRAKLAAKGINVVEQDEEEQDDAKKSSIKTYVEAQGAILRNMPWTFHRETLNSADNHIIKPIGKKEIVNRLREARFFFVTEHDVILTPGFETGLNHIGVWPCAVALHSIDASGWVDFDVTIAKPNVPVVESNVVEPEDAI